MTQYESQIEELIRKTEKDEEILAVILYGSYARGEIHRDVDICLILDPVRIKKIHVTEKGMAYIKEFDLDIHVYQELPLYIQIKILKEGRILHCKDEDLLYDISIETSRKFEDYYPRYRYYLEGVASG